MVEARNLVGLKNSLNVCTVNGNICSEMGGMPPTSGHSLNSNQGKDQEETSSLRFSVVIQEEICTFF